MFELNVKFSLRELTDCLLTIFNIIFWTVILVVVVDRYETKHKLLDEPVLSINDTLHYKTIDQPTPTTRSIYQQTQPFRNRRDIYKNKNYNIKRENVSHLKKEDVVDITEEDMDEDGVEDDDNGVQDVQDTVEDVQDGVEDVQDTVEDVQDTVEDVQDTVEDVQDTVEDVQDTNVQDVDVQDINIQKVNVQDVEAQEKNMVKNREIEKDVGVIKQEIDKENDSPVKKSKVVKIEKIKKITASLNKKK
jgi:hypothetical protein